MAARAAAILLTPYAVDPGVVRGGAQRIAAQLSDRLVELGWTVDIVECPAWRDTVAGDRRFVEEMVGSQVTVRRWGSSASAAPTSPREVGAAVAGACLVLVLDRAVGRLHTDGLRVLVLSNLAYENERRACAQGAHHAIWVPSDHLADQLLNKPGTNGRQVLVVPPALEVSRCEPAPHRPLDVLAELLTAAGVPRKRRMLFPHRADRGKGFATALATLRQLLARERWALIAVRPGDTEAADVWAVFDDATRMATEAGIAEHVFWVPWMPQSEMPCLYGLAGATLMPSDLDEGFGLVAVESLTCGVPVVARPAGNLEALSQQFTDIHTADGVDELARLSVEVAGRMVPPVRRHAVLEAFSVDAQRAATATALAAGTGTGSA